MINKKHISHHHRNNISKRFGVDVKEALNKFAEEKFKEIKKSSKESQILHEAITNVFTNKNFIDNTQSDEIIAAISTDAFFTAVNTQFKNFNEQHTETAEEDNPDLTTYVIVESPDTWEKI